MSEVAGRVSEIRTMEEGSRFVIMWGCKADE